MSFLRGSVMQERLRVESLLLHIERSQLRWFGHLLTFSYGGVIQLEEGHETDPENTRDYISLLSWHSPWCPLTIAGGGSWGEGGLDLSAEAAGPRPESR